VNSAEHIALLILIVALKKCVYQKVASGDCHPCITFKKSQEYKALFGWLEKRLMLMLMLICCERKILLFR